MILQDIYVSTNIITDGEIPGKNSMLSLGSAAYAFLNEILLLDTFTVNLDLLPGALYDENTLKHLQEPLDAWRACRANTISPITAMMRYGQWLEQLPGNIIFLAYPLAYNFSFVDYYMQQFYGKNPFRHNAIDICSYAKAEKQQLPKQWPDDLPFTHVALDKALAQGALFGNVLSAQFNEKYEVL